MTVGTTLLIWYAADQSVTKIEDIDLRLDIKPRLRSSMVITPAPGEARSVRLYLKGPNRAITELRERRGQLEVPLAIDERASGTYTLKLADEYRRHMDRFPEGLAIVLTQPESVTIEVDRYVERELPVQIGEGASSLEQWQLQPEAVKAIVPETHFEAIPPGQRVLTLDISSWVAQATPGELHSDRLVVPRRLGDVEFLEVEPAEVRLSGTVHKRVELLQIKTLPIGVKFSSNELADYRVKFREGDGQVITTELWVRGPTEQITQIREEPARYIEGFIRITHQDLSIPLKAGETIPKTPYFILPPGVELDRPPEELHIELIPRD
jgi:hypothetical protein